MGVYNNRLTSATNPAGYVELGNGLAAQHGTGVFVTSGTSATVKCPFRKLYSVQITPLFATAAQAANGQLTAGGLTHNSDGTMTPTTATQFTVLRAAGTDSALAFSITMTGESRH